MQFSNVKLKKKNPLCRSQLVIWGQTDRQTDRVMQICTCVPLHCESRKMNVESRKKQDQKKWVFFAAPQHTHTHTNMQKPTNIVTEIKKI
jgi:hypothetical protein